jgi:hypothetical protein
METDNVIDISEADLDRPIYRIIPTKYLYPIFARRENTLVSPKSWGDPFENFMLRFPFLLTTGEEATIAFRDEYFGQCWSFKGQSEALWRLYSPEKGTVRIRSTPRKLFTGLCKHMGDWAHVSAYIGRVRYLNKRKLIKYAHTMFVDIDIPRSIDFAKTFLFKRSAFSHEKEVRLLYFGREYPGHAKVTSRLFTYNVEPTDVVDDIRLDPRLTEDEASALEREIRSKTKFKGLIVKSNLYDPPPKLVIPIFKAPLALPVKKRGGAE